MPVGRWALAPAVLALGLTFAAFRLRRRASCGGLVSARTLAAASAAAAACFAGLWLGTDARRAADRDCRARLAPESRVAFSGVALGFLPAGVEGRVALRGAEWTHGGGRCPIVAPVVARLTGPILPGARVRIDGAWSPYPWGQGRPGFLAPVRRGALLADSVLVQPGRFAETPLLAVRGFLARRLAALYPPREAAVAEALVLARRETLDRATYDLFVRAGLAHLLAISGLHVGMVALGWLFVLRAIRVPARRQFAWAAVGVVAYVWVIGAPASALRAAAMVLAALLTRHLGRPSGLWDLYALAACVNLVVDPAALVDPGFQLSFAGAASAMYAGSESRGWLAGRDPTLRAIAQGLAISTATFLGTLPFTLVHFGRASLVGIASNLAAVPLLGLILPALFASLALSAVPPLAAVPTDAAIALLGLLRTVAEVSAAPSWAALDVGPVGVGLAAGLSILVWLLMACTRGPAQRARAILAAGVAVAGVLVAPLAAPFLRLGRALEIVALDVGQGDAIALRTPAGRWLLVDTGPAGRRSDAGARAVVPYLRARGARSLSALILTHPDADHIGGARSVLERMPVRRVLDPGYLAGGRDYVRTLERVAASEAPLLVPEAGDWIVLDGVRIDFLAPADSDLVRAPEANDASLWFVLRYGDFAAAFTGDAPNALEEPAARAAGPVTLLKVAHHGSTTSTSAVTLSLLRPRVALVSVGRRNRYRHPSPEVLARLARAGVEVYRTDREGTIRLEAWSSGRVRVDRP